MAFINIKRGTEQSLINNDPVLTDGELILSTDSLKLKAADGVNSYSNLPVLFSGVYQPTGNYSLVNHFHTSSDINNFNSSVSGLLPVTNIIAGSGVSVSSTSGNFTINTLENIINSSNLYLWSNFR